MDLDKRLLIICGPTATGKTRLALELARKFNGELVSCDSRQVYQFMDVVTGKEIPKNFIYRFSDFDFPPLRIGYYSCRNQSITDNIKIWGYDLVRPDQQFNVQLYLEFVSRAVLYLWSQGKLPIVVGGTGMYLKSLVEPPETLGVPMDVKLRKELDKKHIGELLNLLQERDPDKVKRMNKSDKINPRRLIRAIEVAENNLKIKDLKLKFIKQVLSIELLNYMKTVKGVRILWEGLNYRRRKRLYELIDKRVDTRLAEDQIVGELDYLVKKDYLPHIPAVTIGYQQLIKWMGGEISFEEMVKQWKFAEHGYARRQLTWFKKQTGIHWFEVNERNFKSKVEKLVREWYYRNIKYQIKYRKKETEFRIQKNMLYGWMM